MILILLEHLVHKKLNVLEKDMNASWLIDFLVNEGVIISPVIRITIYSCLYGLCLIAPYQFSTGAPVGDSPLQTYQIMKKTRKNYWVIRNPILKFFLLFHHEQILKCMVGICHLCWISCIIGFGGVYVRTLLAINVFILTGCSYGVLKLGVAHNWLIPMWTIIALIWTSFSQWSVDSIIKSYFEGTFNYDVESESILLDSGFSSKFALCTGCYTLFAAGFAKVRYGGIHWIHPETLSFYIGDSAHLDQLSLAQFRLFVRQIICKRPWLLSLLAVFAIFSELSSIVFLLFPQAWQFLVIQAWIFHVGIFIVMIPNYLSQCICYLVALGGEYPIHRSAWQLGMGDWIVVGTAWIVLICYLLSMLFEVEVFPFTPVTMFSRSRVGYSLNYILDEAQLLKIAQEFPLTNGYTTGGEDQFLESENWIRVVRNSDTSTSLTDFIGVHLCAHSHHFWFVLISAMIKSLQSGDMYYLHSFLLQVEKFLKSDNLLLPNEHLIFQIHLKSGWKTLATSSEANVNEQRGEWVDQKMASKKSK